MAEEKKERRLPPYVGYRTWNTLLAKLKEQAPLPSHLDASYWVRLPFSGSNQGALKSSLVYLGLMAEDGSTLDSLEKLVIAEGEERVKLLSELVNKSYKEILGKINLERATIGQLRDNFKALGVEGDVARKAISFFLSLAKDAGIQLHSSLVVRAQPTRKKKVTVTKSIRQGERPLTSIRGETATFSTLAPAELHPALAGLLKELPKAGSPWPQKGQWKKAWDANLDLVYPSE